MPRSVLEDPPHSPQRPLHFAIRHDPLGDMTSQILRLAGLGSLGRSKSSSFPELPEAAGQKGQAAAEALLATAVLVAILWAASVRGESALAMLWQAWLAHWQRFAAALALPL